MRNAADEVLRQIIHIATLRKRNIENFEMSNMQIGNTNQNSHPMKGSTIGRAAVSLIAFGGASAIAGLLVASRTGQNDSYAWVGIAIFGACAALAILLFLVSFLRKGTK